MSLVYTALSQNNTARLPAVPKSATTNELTNDFLFISWCVLDMGNEYSTHEAGRFTRHSFLILLAFYSNYGTISDTQLNIIQKL